MKNKAATSTTTFYSSLWGCLSNGWPIPAVIPPVLYFLCKLSLFESFAAAYLIGGGFTLVLYYMDKQFAMDNQFRIPEINLHLWELCYGWPGALYAQRKFHHKNSKTIFKFFFWLCAAFNVLFVITCIYLVNNPPKISF